MEFSFLHAADLHLDSPLRGLGNDGPVDRIRGASRRALANLVDFAVGERVAFVLLAGDLYDGDWKDWRTGQFLVEQLGRLKRAGIGVVAIRGNHDADQVLTRELPFPGTMLPHRKPDTAIPIPGVAVHGQSFATRAVTERLALSYPKPLDQHFNIGLLHTACGSAEHDNYAPCTPSELAALEYDYWALGHVHTRQIVSRDPWIVFPGNLQGRHVKEEGDKGATLVRVERGRVASVVHHPLDVVRWQQIEVPCDGLPDPASVQQRVRGLAAAAMATVEDRLLAVRLILTGACPAHAALASDPEATRQAMRAAMIEIADPEQLWLEDVRVQTRPAVDLAALRAQGGAVGALLETINQPADLPTDLQIRVAVMVERFGAGLELDHAARAIAAGVLPEELLDRARALLVAELARS